MASVATSAAAQFTETLSAAATASGGTTVYSGTTSSAPAAGTALLDKALVVAGFVAHSIQQRNI